MKWILSVAAGMLIAGAANAGCHANLAVAAPLVTYQPAIAQTVFQPVVAQYPVYVPPVQAINFQPQYAPPAPIVLEVKEDKRRGFFLRNRQPQVKEFSKTVTRRITR